MSDLNLPQDLDWYKLLAYLPNSELRSLGLGPWGRIPLKGETEDDATGPELWLYPVKWFDHLPNGLPIVDIMYNKKIFNKDTADSEGRFGFLSFGFISALP